MKTKGFLFLFSLLLFSQVSFAESVTFWKGYVFIAGQPASNGTVLEAFRNNATLVANYTIGTIDTSVSDRYGYYMIPVVVPAIDGGYNVSFRVNGVFPYTGANGSSAALQSVNDFGPNLLNISINLTANGGACRPYSGVTNATSYTHSGCSGGYCVHDLCRAAATNCGDGFCDTGESSSSCSADCGTTGTTTSVGGTGGGAATTTVPANATTTVATTISASTTTTTTIPVKVKVNLTANVPKDVEVNTTHVDKITVTSKETVTSVEVKVTETAKPADAPAPVTTGGSVYKYVEITASNIAASSVTKAKISFKVSKSWISSEGVDKNTVALNRLVAGQWTKLTTTMVSESGTEITYEADSPGFSTFAITGTKLVAQPATTAPATTQTTTPKVTSTIPVAPKPTNWPLILAVIVILLAAAAYYKMVHHKKGRHHYVFMPEKHEGKLDK